MSEETDKSQKTERPTQKRLDDAKQKGDVVKSAEVPGWLVLAVAAGLLVSVSGPICADLARRLAAYIEFAGEVSLDSASAAGLFRRGFADVAVGAAAPVLALMIAGVVGHAAQTGLIFAPDKLTPKLNRLSPAEGFKRVFGASAFANFAKGVGKLGIVGVAVCTAIWPRRDAIFTLSDAGVAGVLPIALDATVALLIAALIAYALIAGFDWFGQKHAFDERMKMSLQEIKDEHKQSEGDPHLKARVRQIRQERSRRRMIAAVPTATVVVMNPTHFAVALKYVSGETAAPVCVAKGVDAIALKIRAVAEENRVPVIEDPPLARALYAGVEIDREIPSEHFAAVAKVIGYVLSLAERRRRR